MKPASSDWYAIDLSACARGWMRALHIALALLAALLLTILLGTILGGGDPRAAHQQHVRASLCLEPPQPSALRHDDLADRLAAATRGPADCWNPVALPYIRRPDLLAPAFPQEGLTIARFRWSHVVPGTTRSPSQVIVFVPRVMGWGWRLSADGVALADNLADWRMTWNRPIVVGLPVQHRAAGDVISFELSVAYQTSSGLGLPSITVGTAEALERTIAWRQFLQVSLPQACATTLALLGTFFFAVWLTRRGEKAHLLLALAALAWCVCDLQYLLPRADDPRLEAWYDTIVKLAIAWAMWLVYPIMLRLDRHRLPWMEWALPVYVLGVTLWSLPLWGETAGTDLLFHIVNTTVAALITAVILRAAWRAELHLKLIAGALVLALLAGAHDVALLGLAVDLRSIYLLPFASLLVFGSFLYALQRRYLIAIAEHEHMRLSLARQLAEREAELNANHARLRELERAEALAQERQRLMYDMHDGIGAALLTTLAAVETGGLPQAAVAAALRSCIEDLRMVIDSLEPLGHDLLALLATLRYRLGPRLQASGLELQWDVHDLPLLVWLEAPHALEVLRIIQEAIANVVKHARARTLRITTRELGDRVEVDLCDDGCGFDADRLDNPGRGLRSMARRAIGLGGELEVRGRTPRGTCVRLRLPVSKR